MTRPYLIIEKRLTCFLVSLFVFIGESQGICRPAHLTDSASLSGIGTKNSPAWDSSVVDNNGFVWNIK